MIVDTIALKLNSPETIFENPTYPSGLYPEQSSVYTFGYKEKDYPLMTLASPIFDNCGNALPVGYYLIALSDDKKFLLIIQSNILKAKIPVFKLTELMPDTSEIQEKANLDAELEKARMKKNLKKIKKAEVELKNFNMRILAKMSATIEDSGQGYYILKYSRLNIKACGIISK